MGNISITKATAEDCSSIASIGKMSVAESHKGSSSTAIMNEFLNTYYNEEAIRKELNGIDNIYYLIKYDDIPAGFSKIVLNAGHPDIPAENIAKLDRIYLLKQFYGLKLGLELLNFNIRLAKNENQAGMWLYAWVGNVRAVDFYLKAGFKIIGSHNYYVTETHFDVSHHMLLDFADQDRQQGIGFHG